MEATYSWILPSSQRMKRGDVVRYREKLYFFQGNGNTCYLYEQKKEIGMTKRAIVAHRLAVRLATDDEKHEFLASRVS